MQLVVWGLNHKTAPVEVRERFSLSGDQVRHGLRRLNQYGAICECVILSTCNRTEMYAVVDDAQDARTVLGEYLGGISGGRFMAEDSVYCYEGEACIRHLLRVAAGLDSLVVGEGQILSQVKKAYSIARDSAATGTILNTLFHRAITAGKKVRTATRIAQSAVSVSCAAVELARKVLGDLSSSSVLVLGAGEISELTARHLVDNGVKTVFVSNRNFDRAAALAEKFHGKAVPFGEFMGRAVEADIVITSTGAPHYIIRAWDVAHLMQARNGRPIIFIDIAVPRDVEPEAGAIAGVRLYNIDALEAVVAVNMEGRRQEAQAAATIVDEEVAGVLAKFRYLAFRPTLAALADKAERIRRQVVKRAFAKLPAVSAEDRKVVENMSKMLVRKILREPIVNITEAAGTGREQYCLAAVRTLFKLEEAGKEEYRDNETCRRHPRQ